MSNLVFVATDGKARVPAAQRGLIRSHCMREKNKQPHSRRSKREARKSRAIPRGGSAAPSSTESAPVSSDEDGPSDYRDEALAVIRQTRVPGPPPSDWALIKFPVEMDRTSQMHFHRYFTCNPIRDPVFPFKLFGIRVDVHADEVSLPPALIHDELFFRAMELMVTSSNDLIYGCGLANRTRRKLVELFPLLNARLAQPNAHRDGMSLYVVGILASVAILFGEYASASVHAKGMAQIIRLRGSNTGDRTDLMLGLALDRMSFASSLLTEEWTPLDGHVVRKTPIFPEEVTISYEAQNMIRADWVPDARLAFVFHALQCTTITLNTHDFGAPCISGARFYENMGFVQSELLSLRGQLTHNLSHCIHLSLLAFLATTFRVPGQWEHPCCAKLAEPLLAACAKNKKSITALPKAVQTWLLLVGLMTATALGDERVRVAWRHLLPIPRGPWGKVRGEAKRVMWIDAIHDTLGGRAFDTLQLSSE